MSNINVGPYIVVTSTTMIEHERLICPNGHKDHNFKQGGFCSECGSKIEIERYTQEEPFSLWKTEEWGIEEDTFYTSETNAVDGVVLFPNHRGYNESLDGGIINIAPEDISIAIDKFKNGHAKELKILDDHNVDYTIEYGVVVSFS